LPIKIVTLVISMWVIFGTTAILGPKTAIGEVRFVAAGDTRGSDNGVNTAILQEIVQATLDENAEFIIVMGDLVNGSSDTTTLESQLTTWRTVMMPLYDNGVGVYPCRGNHDTGSKAVWDRIFSGKYVLPDNGPGGEKYITYSFTHDNVFIVGLDQYVDRSRVNQAWLDEQFCRNYQPHVFVFGHEPAFKVSHTDCLDNHPNDRNEFWNSIAAEGGRIYFAGHDHFYDHTRLDDGDGDLDNDLHQYVVGHGGAPLYNDPGEYNGDNGLWTPQRIDHQREYGYVLVVVDGLHVTVTNKLRVAANDFRADDIFVYSITIPSNQAPCTDAGPGRVITSPDDTVSLNGTVYDDGFPDPPAGVSTTWHMEKGPAAVVFEDDSIPVTTVTFFETGTYVFELTADDGELTAGDKTVVTVNPEVNDNPVNVSPKDDEGDEGGCFADTVKN